MVENGSFPEARVTSSKVQNLNDFCHFLLERLLISYQMLTKILFFSTSTLLYLSNKWNMSFIMQEKVVN